MTKITALILLFLQAILPSLKAMSSWDMAQW
jgi:hypothetical protein